MRKIVLTIIIVVLLIIIGFVLKAYIFQGYPGGFKDGRLIIYQYTCSDVCPDAGGWHKEYFGVDSKEECEQIGGDPFIDPAWGAYLGCIPK
jgi:hypothetical protein